MGTETEYMTVAEMENYVPYEVFKVALDKLTLLEQVVDALPSNNIIPTMGRVTTISENMDGSYYLRWTAGDPVERPLDFSLKVGTSEFENIYPMVSNGFYTYMGETAPAGSNPSYIKVTNGLQEVISDLFTIAIPSDPTIIPPHISEISNIQADINEPIKIMYSASDSKTSIVKHEFSDDGKTYNITNSVLKSGETYIYKLSYNSIINIKKAYITVYNQNGMRTKSNDFAISVIEPAKAPSLLEFEIIPSEYITEGESIEIKYTSEKPLKNVKISLNGGDFVSATTFTNEKATFSVKGLSNGSYTAKLRGYYEESETL